jgi:hypothetical protein
MLFQASPDAQPALVVHWQKPLKQLLPLQQSALAVQASPVFGHGWHTFGVGC